MANSRSKRGLARKQDLASLPLFFYAIRQVRARETSFTSSLRRVTIGTGHPRVDAALGGGFTVGQSALLAARQGAGMTALLLGTALAAVRRGLRVAYFSETYSESQLRGRLVLLVSQVNSFRLQAGLAGEGEQEALAAARAQIAWSGLGFFAKPALTVAEIDSHICNYRPHLVIVDARPRLYDAGGRSFERFDELRAGAARLSEVARDHGVALVVRHVLPRRPHPSRVDDLPGNLADYFASVVLLRRGFSSSLGDALDEPSSLARVLVMRHRGEELRPPRRAALHFDHRYAGFADL